MKDNKKMVEAITPINEDFAQWYTDICLKAELVDYSAVKGLSLIHIWTPSFAKKFPVYSCTPGWVVYISMRMPLTGLLAMAPSASIPPSLFLSLIHI